MINELLFFLLAMLYNVIKWKIIQKIFVSNVVIEILIHHSIRQVTLVHMAERLFGPIKS